MRGRFAPSPTGVLHLGNLRTGLVAWLFARSAGSEFYLRFEDLDSATVQPELYDSQRRDLERLGLDWDAELRQSEHLRRYQRAVQDLTDLDLTYPCFCSRREIREAIAAPHADLPDGAYPGTCRDLSPAVSAGRVEAGDPWALRLRSDGETRSFVDGLAGAYSGRPDDQVLTRRDGTPAYNLVVVVDDDHQGVEQVVRADDLLSSTPRQLQLAELLGIDPPSYAHVPLVLGPSGARLAKRDGSVTLDDRIALGETSAQVRGVLAASLGLTEAGTEPSLPELIDRFDPALLSRRPWQLSADDLGG